MKNIINQSELIIFDMDGTLYEGRGHYDFYAHHLSKTLPLHIQKPFLQTYEMVMNHEHSLEIGTVYDVDKDWILHLQPITLEVMKATNWEGEEVLEKELAKVYVGRIPLEHEKRFVSVGDGWWVPIVIAVHYGIVPSFDSYFATKKYMVTTEGAMEKTEGLEEALSSLRKSKKLAVVTNSDREDAKTVLETLNLTSFFDTVVTSARKPIKTAEVFVELCKRYDIPVERAVSIGDNFLNEIYPAIDLGMKGIHITTRLENFSHERYYPVRTLKNMLL